MRDTLAKAPAFVVQLHHASHRHFDFRLQVGNSLRSWAIPKGPSLDPTQKRLAVEVEDHPLAYRHFEGEIPAGQYGAGTVAIWDRGHWIADDDAETALTAGKLGFSLHGERLRGRWTLVRTGGRRSGRKAQWLLMKAEDDFAVAGDAADDRALTTPSKAATPGAADLQLTRLVDTAPTGSRWLHEIKYDGYRLLMTRDGERVSLQSRNGQQWTERLPRVAAALRALPSKQFILDGELVVLDAQGRSDFGLLQQAMRPEADTSKSQAVVFDLMMLDGRDWREQPQLKRKAALARLIPNTRNALLQRADFIQGRGTEVFAQACAQGLEGIVSKACSAPYRAGRSGQWLKLKCVASDEFVIVGYTRGQGSRTALGALLLAKPEPDGGWRYAGRVGSGFDDALLKALPKALGKSRAKPTFSNAEVLDTARGGQPVWVAPKQVVEVHYRGITADGVLRQASFKTLRTDKATAELHVPDTAETSPSAAKRVMEGSTSMLTHPERRLFERPRITKQALADFYAEIGDSLLQFLQRRPISLLRCPDGIQGECFFQRHLTAGFPSAVREETIAGRRSGIRKVIYIESIDGLIGLVQMGTIEIHAWGARLDDIERPDRIVFDLDPGIGVAWQRVIDGARFLRDRLAAVGLESAVLTSGGKGLHVVVPLKPSASWLEVKAFSRAVAQTCSNEHPEAFVAVSGERNRRGRIFIDYLRNSRGASSVAPYSLRARAQAPVATPIRWNELSRVKSPTQFHFGNLNRRLSRLATDPWAELDGLDQLLPSQGL